MTLIKPSTDYTNRDFDAIRERVFNIIPSAFPEWTDAQTANYGNLLVELFCYVMDVLSYYQDNQARESRWSTAQLRRSLLSIAKLIGYKSMGNAAATVELACTLSAPPVGNVVINAGDTFQTLDAVNPIVFEAVESATITAGSTTPLAFVTASNSAAHSDVYVSAGLPTQSYQLSFTPFLDGSLLVSSSDQGAFDEVNDFLESVGSDKHYTLVVDENSRASVTFGNGIAGLIPTGDITFAYRVGGGIVGNVAAGTVARAVSAYIDTFGNSVALRVTNNAAASGGADRQTVEAMREAAPRSLRALTRTICREDYEINALRVGGVARALMLTRDETPAIPENQGRLFIVPSSGGVATDALLAAVFANLTIKYPKGITFKLAVLPALYLTVNVVARVHFAKGTNVPLAVVLAKKAVADFFALYDSKGANNSNVDFGFYLDGAIAWSDVFNAVRDVAGIRKIDDGLGNLTLNGEADDLAVPLFQFPLLGTVTVVDAVTGTAL